MRRIICSIPRRRLAASGDGGSGRGFLPTGPYSGKLNVRTPHTFVKVEEEAKFTDIFGVFVGQSSCVVRKQLKNEERARKAVGILFRDYCGRATRDDADSAYDEEKAKVEAYEEELNAFVTNLNSMIKCEELDYKTCICVCEVLDKVLDKVVEKKMMQHNTYDELGEGARWTQNDRVDEIAEMAEDLEEELDAFLTNSFLTNLMNECEPKYEKRFRKVLEKVRKKMIQDDRILDAFVSVTNLMIRCEPEYEKLLCEVLEKIRENITQDEELDDVPRTTQNDRDNELADEYYGHPGADDEVKVGTKKVVNENIRKIEKLAKLAKKVGNIAGLDEELGVLVTDAFLNNLMKVENMKPYFIAYEVIEKVAKKAGNENIRKIAEGDLDSLVTELFVTNLVGVEMMKPFIMGKWMV